MGLVFSGGWNSKHILNSNGRDLFCFVMVFGFQMVDKMAAMLFLDYWKTELQNVRYSYVFGIPMFRIQAPTVLSTETFLFRFNDWSIEKEDGTFVGPSNTTKVGDTIGDDGEHAFDVNAALDFDDDGGIGADFVGAEDGFDGDDVLFDDRREEFRGAILANKGKKTIFNNQTQYVDI